jgi:hypothetical protein
MVSQILAPIWTTPVKGSVVQVHGLWRLMLAALILASPGATLFAAPETELCEPSDPIEEQNGGSEFFEVTASSSRRVFVRQAFAEDLRWPMQRGVRSNARRQLSRRHIAGHRLPDGHCAPQLC